MVDYTLGNKIYELRKKKGLSQKQLGEALGVSNKAVSKWETGAAVPKIQTIVKLAGVFDISAEELLSGKCDEMQSLDGLSQKTKNMMLRQRLDEIENENRDREFKASKIYLIGLFALFVTAFAISAVLTFSFNSMDSSAFSKLGIEYESNTNTVENLLISFLCALIPAGTFTGFYLFGMHIRRVSPALIVIFSILFVFTIFIIVFGGEIMILPTVISSIKAIIRRNKKNELK